MHAQPLDDTVFGTRGRTDQAGRKVVYYRKAIELQWGFRMVLSTIGVDK